MIVRQAQDNVYLVDVRTREEYLSGHIPGFTWFPGGQVVQRSDDVAVVKNTPIVFACDGFARSTLVASWYRQMGMEEVYAVDGGTPGLGRSGAGTGNGRPRNPGVRPGRGRKPGPTSFHPKN